MTFETLLFTKQEHVAWLTFNRPHKLNAGNEQMWAEAVSALRDAAEDNDVRVVVITGAGRAFCVGADLSAGKGGEQIVERHDPLALQTGLKHGPQQVVRLLYNMEKPTIAMVNGDAVGAGFDFALACDIRFGSEKARFMVAFTRLGLVPGAGGAWLMARAMGAARAAQYIFSADFIQGARAVEMGILNEMFSADRLEEETTAFARRLSKNPPVALRLSKMLLRKAQETDLDTLLELTAACQAICISTEDNKEGVAAFREKREPVFEGR
ncbi:MAG: enoyl-CoA hydratase/isomerase family protein [Chloroflexi bacterium]|nr:enoyl-CoA hydratase/isomerase family protein [Chloroflexota bacterium]